MGHSVSDMGLIVFFLGPFPLAEIPKDKDTHRQSTLQHFFVVLSITCSMEYMSEWILYLSRNHWNKRKMAILSVSILPIFLQLRFIILLTHLWSPAPFIQHPHRSSLFNHPLPTHTLPLTWFIILLTHLLSPTPFIHHLKIFTQILFFFFSIFSLLCEGLFFCRVGVGVVGHQHRGRGHAMGVVGQWFRVMLWVWAFMDFIFVVVFDFLG